MIKRFVKMTFEPGNIEEFVSLFDSKKKLIAAVEGCTHLELLQDDSNPCIFFTYSIWNTTDHIENYRQSELFKSVWAKTKPLFSHKAEAWSLKVK